MDKEHFSKLLIEQQDRGKALLSLISNMHESKNDFGDGIIIFGGEDLYYVPEDELDEFQNKFAGWKSYVRELLNTQFGGNDQYVYEWESAVETYVSKKKPILNQLKKNVNKGLALIESILQRLEIHFHVDGSMEEAIKLNNVTKRPMVFISHSSKDAGIISCFVEQILRLGLGLAPEDIAFTSEETFGVEPGEDIAKYIREKISGARVILLMISSNYKGSDICLNEMGAAWALGKKCISVVLPNADFSDIGWLSSLEKAVQLCDKSQVVSLSSILASLFQIDLTMHFKSLSSGIDKFISSIVTITTSKKTAVKNSRPIESSQGLKVFDVSFNSVCLGAGEYVVRIDLRMRSEESNISLRRVFLRNKQQFTDSSVNVCNELEFKSYLDQDTINLTILKKEDIAFWKKEYPQRCHKVIDVTIEKGHNLSFSFCEYFFTVRECDGYDELQLKGWSLVIQYNVDSEMIIPLELVPVDKVSAGKYWNN